MNCPLETRENALLLARLLRPQTRAGAGGDAGTALRGVRRLPGIRRGQRAVWQALDGWEAAPVSLDFDRRLYQRIEAQAPWWSLLLRPLRPPFSAVTLRRSLPAAAMACLLVVAGVVLERPAVSPVPPPHDTAQVDSVQPEQVERTLDAMEC